MPVVAGMASGGRPARGSQNRSRLARHRRSCMPASITIPAPHDLEPFLPALPRNAIHQPVLAENAAGAPALQRVLQRLRRAEALARNALDVADQFVDPRAHPFVRLLPVQIVVPGGFGPCRLHRARSARLGHGARAFVNMSRSASAIARNRREALAGLFSKCTVSIRPL